MAKAQREDWKRAVALVGSGNGLGEALGELYVARYFKPQAKAAMDTLVENLRAALRQNIEHIDWMQLYATKVEAYRKLSTFRPKIGYLSKWKDYSSVTIQPGYLLQRPPLHCASTTVRIRTVASARKPTAKSGA
ncbi:MAG: hypothetical protein U1F19_01930 [Lysobacterales bacterium]